jgi:hypothetical protein
VGFKGIASGKMLGWQHSTFAAAGRARASVLGTKTRLTESRFRLESKLDETAQGWTA